MANTKPLASQVRYGRGNSTTVDTVLNRSVLQYGTQSEARAAAATLPNGQVIEVTSDETKENLATRYVVSSGVLVFVKYVDQLRQDLAATSGSAIVGFDGGTVQDVLDYNKPLANYTALRAYTGRATIVRITNTGLSGLFQRDISDTTSTDNGGIVIVDASGRRWKRIVLNRCVLLSWFEQSKFHERVNTASLWLANTGGGEILLDSSSYTQTGRINILPNVRIRGLGIDKTRIDFTGSGVAFAAAKNGAERHRDSELSHFLINSTLGREGGATAVQRGNSTFCKMHHVQVANFTVGQEFPMLVDGALSESYFNKTEQCWFASCANAIWFSGASNRNTFDTNTYTDCSVAYNFSESGNVCETNTFINENVEGCHSWAEWPVGTIYSQTWIGCIIENPSTNGYVCSVKDPGRQVFVNLALIPSRNSEALAFYHIRSKPSSVFGSLASSEALGFDTRVEEELALYGGLRLRSQIGAVGYSGIIPAGASHVVTIPIAGATIGDVVVASSNKDLLGCILTPWVSGAGTVSVRIQNGSGGNTSLSSITIKAFCVKSDI